MREEGMKGAVLFLFVGEDAGAAATALPAAERRRPPRPRATLTTSTPGQGLGVQEIHRQRQRPSLGFLDSMAAVDLKDLEISSDTGCLSIVVLGASGDLAKKKTFPALFNLFQQIQVDLSLSAHANARRWYEMKKKQETKQERTITAHEKAFKAAKKKTRL